MQNKKIVSDFLKQQNIKIPKNKNSDGLNIKFDNEDLLIQGSSEDLIELADLLVSCALSNVEGDHFHIDDLTLLSVNSEIKSIIVEQK